MAEQKILISIQINDSQAAKTNKALKVTKDNFNSLTDAEMKSIVADKQKALSAKAVDKALTGQAAAANAAAKSTDNMRATSGLNNAIIMETSRLASDASFGFTAIANNLSQLVNLFQMNVKATGSFSSAIAGLFTTQAAFLVGIQLLITYGDRLFEVFMKLVGVSKVYRDALKDAGGEVQSLSGKFEVYVSTLQDVNSTQEEQKIAINGLKKEFPEYINQLKEADLTLADVANKTEEATKQNDLYKDSLLELAMSRAAMNSIEEASAEIISLRIEREAKMMDLGFEERVDANGKIITVEQQVRDELADLESKYQYKYGKIKQQFRMDKLRGLLSMNEEEIKEEESKIDKLVKLVDLENKKLKKAGEPRERDFKQQLLNLDKLEESYRQKSIDQTLLTEDEKIDIEEKFAKKELEIRLNQFKERQKLRLDEFLESKASDSEKLQAQKDYNESIILAEQERNDVLIQLEESFDTKRNKLERKRAETAAADVKKAREIQEKTKEDALQDLTTLFESTNALFYEQNAIFLQNEIDNQNTILNNVHATETQKQEAIQRTAELQRQLRENEYDAAIAEIEFKKSIQLEYVGFAQQTSQLLSTLAGKNKGLQNAALAIEKGAAIAKIIVSANASVLARKAGNVALANPVLIAADAPLMAADIARIKIGAGLSIANILATTLTNAKGKKPSGGDSGGGGRTIQAPDFNVVGASQTSQLAETVAGQQSKPVKAFVVGKDISTQQELDRNITNTASFG
jgi:hypothetical protein